MGAEMCIRDSIEPMHLCVSSNKKENLLYISFYDKAKEQNLIGLLKRGF